MFEKLPDLVDPVHCAEHNMRFKASVNQSALSRLEGLVLSTKGEVQVDIRFGMHRGLKSPEFDLTVETELELECQTSLQAYKLPVKSHVRGVFVSSLALAEDLQEDIEVYELPAGKLSLLELVEDEVLLAIPMVPRIEEADINWQDEPLEEVIPQEQEAKPSPFAELEKLKQ
jgi:uncharacterized protein